tara:strand:+ start:132 stop:599 length:468 start_codon:yes stop_codon:yes gene_type:complete
MAKRYILGDEFRLYYNIGSYASQNWKIINAADSISVDYSKADVPIAERGQPTGHLQGVADPSFSFTLLNDVESTYVQQLIDRIDSAIDPETSAPYLIHLAVANGDITVAGTKLYHMECILLGGALTADQGAVSSFDIEARRHANSEYGLVRATVS